MIKNENGYVLVLVTCMSTILLYVFLHFISLYSVEQRFLKEREEYEELQSLLQVASIDIANKIFLIGSEIGDGIEGSFSYPHGKVTYKIIPYDEQLLRVTMKNFTKNNRKNGVILLYDRTTHLIQRWSEG